MEEDRERWSLVGAAALVTAGTRGIGHAIVEELARFGAAVHTCARNEAELEKCLQRWGAMHLKVTGSVCDVSSPTEREKLMERVKSIFNGKLNILVSRSPSFFFILSILYGIRAEIIRSLLRFDSLNLVVIGWLSLGPINRTIVHEARI
ncbi:hypothetical protein C4D60_Mb05t13220 [Musa balbisiana]|uniref:Uncharacterized protein n=1 Tax=Musa balbisiana TaxID=52838 RepID=A0A4S8JVU5_MUSBA|nr:hypothetical protein C4D60_Mb05t13220 [Musa balbisiana]